MLLNTPKAYNLAIEANSTFGGANLTALAGVGVSLVLDGSLLTNSVSVQLNGDPDCEFFLDVGTVLGFGRNDIQFTSIDFANTQSGASNQVLQFICGVVPATALGALK